jgi:hypothetical protein
MVKLIDILNEIIEEKADRCLRIARRKYDKPSAYRSGAIVKCRQGKIWTDLKESDQEDSVKYIKPNFEFEWEEAIRYPEFVEIGKDNWIKLGNRGHAVNYSDIEDSLGNVDLDFDSLDIDKQSRFKKAFRSGIIEYPIAVKFSDNHYDLVAGNTRLAGLVEFGIDPKIWVVDLSQLTEAKKESLHKWFSHRGGGWVDCNTCRDGKCKPCGRQKGEKRAKYPSCRPTPAACKQKGKGKTWGKTK